MDLELSEQERRLLQSLGQTTHGRGLVSILNRYKDHFSSVDTIKGGGDYGAQVEGRKIFREFAKEIIQALNSSPKSDKRDEPDDFS